MTDKIQINDLVRDATPEEAARIRQIRAEALAAEGLTPDEVAALLGA